MESPCGLCTVSPCSCTARARFSRSKNVTSWPACASRAPKYPPVAPAPTTNIRMRYPFVSRHSETPCLIKLREEGGRDQVTVMKEGFLKIFLRDTMAHHF